ncbi:MAG: lytic transglycosylase domain-containing protein [Porticoccaceae bacterium]
MKTRPVTHVYRTLLLGLWLCATSTAGAATILSWRDSDGVTHYSNVPRANAERDATRLALTPAAHAAAAHNAIYKYRDGTGVIHYTDRQPAGENFVVVQTYCPACDPHSTLNWDTVRLRPDAFRDEIAGAARRWQVDPALVRAVIHAESAFNPEAISRAGAQGLMQLMPATAGDYGVTDAFDIHQNIDAGTRLLADLLARYRGNTELAAAAYNAGAGAVEQHGGVPPFAETQVYVRRVATLHRRYQGKS